MELKLHTKCILSKQSKLKQSCLPSGPCRIQSTNRPLQYRRSPKHLPRQSILPIHRLLSWKTRSRSFITWSRKQQQSSRL